jgi:hypothetical protein
MMWLLSDPTAYAVFPTSGSARLTLDASVTRLQLQDYHLRPLMAERMSYCVCDQARDLRGRSANQREEEVRRKVGMSTSHYEITLCQYEHKIDQ